jgi:DNA mismatch endonuclease (patch repair protein)
MVDRVSEETRSYIMSTVASKNTGPEISVRKTLHRLGYRYRLHKKTLPGSPDIAFPKKKKVVFVHGCFWHGHNCKYGRLPKSKTAYWNVKIEVNKERDHRNILKLKDLGWKSMIVWQCQLKDMTTTIKKLVAFLGPPKTN